MPDFYRFDESLFKRTDLTPAAKMVYLAIRDRIGNNGKCWPGQRRLADDCGIGYKAVNRAVAELVTAGIVIKTDGALTGRREDRTCRYSIPDVPKTGTLSNRERSQTGNVNVPKQGTSDVPESGTEIDQYNQTNQSEQYPPPAPQGVAHPAPPEANPDLFGEVSTDPPDPPTTTPAAFVWPDDVWSLIASSIRRPGMDTPELREAWADWCGYWREEVRKPFGRRVAINQLRALEEHTPADAVAMIRNSIGSGYKRLVFPTNNGDGRNGQRGSAQVVRSDGTGYAEFLAAMTQRGTR